MKNLIFVILIGIIVSSCNNKKASNIESSVKAAKPVHLMESSMEVYKTEVEKETLAKAKRGFDSLHFTVGVNYSSDLLSSIQPEMVKTITDYTKLKDSLITETMSIDTKEFQRYQKDKNEAFVDYINKTKAELLKVRDKNFDVYVKWLDADKLQNWTEKSRIEGTKEFSEYVQTETYAYDTYKEKDSFLYERYKSIRDKAWEEFRFKDGKAYEGYLANNKK